MAILSTFNATTKENRKLSVSLREFYETLVLFRESSIPIYKEFLALPFPENFKEAKSRKIDLTPVFQEINELKKWKMKPSLNKITKVNDINIGEFINQMANLETLLFAIEFSLERFKDYELVVCSPASTHSKHEFDSDLLLKHPTKEEYVCFEFSDVLDYNANDKLAKDLNTLHKKQTILKSNGRYFIFSNPLLFGNHGKTFYLKTAKKSKNAKVYLPKNKDKYNWHSEVHLKSIDYSKTETLDIIGYEVFFALACESISFEAA